MSLAGAQPRLVMTGVCKRFGPTAALAGVDLLVRPAEVHALIGENGAGKSTLMKILSGALLPDAGEMLLDGRPYRPANPNDARHAGIAMIYQELNLAPHLTVEENLCLGIEQTRGGLLRRGPMRRKVQEALAQLAHDDIRPDVPVRTLSVGAQQLVEVARALMTEARVIVMDEPTSSLTREDVHHLFTLIRRLRERGVSLVYISHFLEEVQAISGRFTVLRDGRTVATGETASTPTAKIIEQMVGRDITEMFPAIPHQVGEPVLHIERLSGRPMPTDVDLTLHRGEILGLAGLIGAGRTELLRTLFGLAPVRSGQVQLCGVDASSFSSGPQVRAEMRADLRSAAKRADAGATPHDRIAQGFGMVSEDRKAEGLALPMSIADNVTLSGLSSVGRWGILNLARQRQAAGRWMEHLNIRARGPRQAVWDLSGGNQQKVAIARLLHQEADVLLLDEPTRGIDVGAKVEIYRLMGELAAQGKAILFVSSYLPELMGICDRIAVMRRGRLVACKPRPQWTEQEIMSVATGGAG